MGPVGPLACRLNERALHSVGTVGREKKPFTSEIRTHVSV
jgi:hypothetical protein